MTISVLPIDVNDDTWGDVCTKVNALINIASNNAVTAGGNTAVGNVGIQGTLTVNSIVIIDSIAVSSALSALSVTANTGNFAASLTTGIFQANVATVNSAIAVTANVTTINANTLNVNNIPTFTSTSATIGTANLNILRANTANVASITANTVVANTISVDVGTIGTANLNILRANTANVASANIAVLYSGDANTNNFRANVAIISSLQVGTLTGFNPTSMTLDTLTANTASIRDLTISGTISGYIPVNFAVSNNLTSNSASIVSLGVASLSANTQIIGPLVNVSGAFVIRTANASSFGSGEAQIRYYPSNNSINVISAANTIPKFEVGTPSNDNHATTKKYTDDALALKANLTDLQVAPLIPTAPSTSANTANWNSLTAPGWNGTLMPHNASNGPPESGSYFVTIAVNNGNNLTQIAYPLNPETQGIWLRGRVSGTWGNWTRSSPKITVSTTSPSGGLNGDIWLQV